MQEGKTKTLPYRQERMMLKTFNVMSKCAYDATGLNKDWFTKISVDERSMIKNLFRDSGP